MATYLELADVKSHLRVDFSDDDTYIGALIDLVEELILTEIQGSITGEGTVTTAGTTALVGSDTNFTDFIAGDTITVEGETIRTIATITDDENLTVDVAFTGSEGELSYVVHPGIPDPCPKALEHAMLLMVGHFYMIREPVVIGVGVTKIPYTFETLIAPFKNWTVA